MTLRTCNQQSGTRKSSAKQKIYGRNCCQLRLLKWVNPKHATQQPGHLITGRECRFLSGFGSSTAPKSNSVLGMQKVVWGAPSFWIERFPLYWVIHKGFFVKQGIDLDILYGYGAPKLTHAVSNGRIRIGKMGLPPFVTAFRKGLRAKIIGSSEIQQLVHYLAALPNISSTADLASCRISILSTGSCDDYFIHKMLSNHNSIPVPMLN